MSFDRWRANPVSFITEKLIDPETDKPFELNPSQLAFLVRAFELDDQGRLRHPELLYSAPKKSGKTAFAAMIVLTMVLLFGGRHAEVLLRGQRLRSGAGPGICGCACWACRPTGVLSR